MSFAALKKQSKTAIETLSKTIEQDRKGGGYQRDERYWELTVGKEGSGMATIRFLPPPPEEERPFVKLFSYFIKWKNKWYVENCRSTLGDPDPMNEYFFFVRGDNPSEEQKNKARKFSRGTGFIANILVIDDPAVPENNGKTFLYKFGPRIMSKIEGAIQPEFGDEEPFNPFDFWSGADFKLKARMLDGQRSYDKSGFDSCGPVAVNGKELDDAALEKLWNGLHSLKAEIAPDKFKPYDELKAKRDKFIKDTGLPSPDDPEGDSDYEEEDERPRRTSRRTDDDEREEPKPRRTEKKSNPWDDEDDFHDNPSTKARSSSEKAVTKDSADDDDLAAFRKMLQD